MLLSFSALAACQASVTETSHPSTAAIAPSPDAPFVQAMQIATTAVDKSQTAHTAAEWQTVAETWQMAIDAMKAVPKVHQNYSQAQQKVVEYQKNLEYASQRAKSMNPNVAAGPGKGLSEKEHFHQAIHHYLHQDPENAVKNFDKAIELNAAYAEAYFNRGVAKLELKDQAGALQDLEKAAALYTDRGDKAGASVSHDRIKQIQQGGK